jgi:hypothetical protein
MRNVASSTQKEVDIDKMVGRVLVELPTTALKPQVKRPQCLLHGTAAKRSDDSSLADCCSFQYV